MNLPELCLRVRSIISECAYTEPRKHQPSLLLIYRYVDVYKRREVADKSRSLLLFPLFFFVIESMIDTKSLFLECRKFTTDNDELSPDGRKFLLQLNHKV